MHIHMHNFFNLCLLVLKVYKQSPLKDAHQWSELMRTKIMQKEEYVTFKLVKKMYKTICLNMELLIFDKNKG